MFNILLEKLKAANYSTEEPDFFKYSSELYSIFLNGQWLSFKGIFPESFQILNKQLKLEIESFDVAKFHNKAVLPSEYSNVSSLIESIDDIKTIMSDNPQHAGLFLRIMLFQKIFFLSVISLQNKKLTYESDDIFQFLDKKIQFSQTFIAKEWEIDNDTLSKWFEIQYGTNIFAKRKRIKLSEYIIIFKDFFILDEHKKDDSSNYAIQTNDIDFYNSLSLKGKTYSKKDIIEECFNPELEVSPRLYEQAKIILEKKFSYYSHLNKYPTSIAFQLIAELKKSV